MSNIPGLSVGYSTCMENLLPKINIKYPSSLWANFGLEGYAKQYLKSLGDIPIYSKGYNSWDEQMLPHIFNDFNADALITLYDMHAASCTHSLVTQHRIPWVAYEPLDTEEPCQRHVDVLNSAFKIVPMSEHGEREFRKVYPGKTTRKIPLGFDKNTFKPLWNTVEEKNKLKRTLHFDEDCFLITLAGDIKGWRKMWPVNIEAVKIFMDNNPDVKTRVYIHTKLQPTNPFDFNVQALVQKLGLGGVARFVEQYAYLKGVSYEAMNQVYNASDVYCMASYAEGFSMMPLEAAGAGTPSIGTNFTSTDTIEDGKTGFLVKPLFKFFDQTIGKRAMPDAYDIADKLKKVCDRGSVSFRDDCVAFARPFDWDLIVEKYWFPFLEQLEQDLSKACFKIPQPSEKLRERAKPIIV